MRTVVREFKASVSADLEAMNKRITDLSDEVRRRISTAEVAIVNEIRSLSERFDHRIERVETRVDEIDGRLDGHDARFDAVDARFNQIDMTLAEIKALLT